MVKIIGVRFRRAGKLYYFDPEDHILNVGDFVVVETSRGIECGRVVLPVTEIDESEVVSPLKKLIRRATEEDVARVKENKARASEAFFICKQRIRRHHLEMKLIDAEYTFDNKKVLFYFTAEGRVDFRELIKDLASVFKTRIELRQIGVRDETKMMNGIGICGRPLCCATFLSDFAPVSIKMAKEQNLSLNPTKISGVCGRLMCCLKNEQETYEHLNSVLPGIGDTVEAPGGIIGEVQQVNILRQIVRILVENGDEIEAMDFHVSELSLVEKHKKGKPRRKLEYAGHNQENRTERKEGKKEPESEEASSDRGRKPEHRHANEEAGQKKRGRREVPSEETRAEASEARRERNRRRRERRREKAQERKQQEAVQKNTEA